MCKQIYDAFQIPASVFNADEKLVFACSPFGVRQMEFYLSMAAGVLQHSGPVCLSEANSPAWIVLPCGTDTILIGPVQTGHDPSFLFTMIPEYSDETLVHLAQYFCIQLYGNKDCLQIMVKQKEDTAVLEITYEVDPMPELYESIRTGNTERLQQLVHMSAFDIYLSMIMATQKEASIVFQFNLTRCYHISQNAGVPYSESTGIVARYQKEAEQAKTPNAFRSLLLNVMYDFTNVIRKMRYYGNSPLVRNARIYIIDHVYEPVSIDAIAEFCSVSRSTLSHRFAKETGLTLKQEILIAKLTRAKWFLENTGLSCADIAYRLGFSSQSWFIRQFRSLYGTTPALWREKRD